jgi:hypothetical protein
MYPTAFFKLSFQRVPNSGALIGQSNAYRINTMSKSQVLLARGDIIVPDELLHLMICTLYPEPTKPSYLYIAIYFPSIFSSP